MGLPLVTFAVLTTVVLFLVVVMGFVDTATQSALGCGHSFPLCHGRLLPTDNMRAIIEWSHRVLAAVAGVLVAILAVWTWVRIRHDAAVRWLVAIALGFLLVESVVGAIAVLVPESQGVIAVHLGIALTSFAATALATQRLWGALTPANGLRDHGGPPPRSGGSPPAMAAAGGGGAAASLTPSAAPAPRPLVWWSWLTLVYMYAAIYLGAYVAGTRSGYACLTWPLCPEGRATVSLTNPVTIDLLHRTVALGAAVVGTYLFLLASRARATRPDLSRLAHVVLALIVLQIISGLVLVLTQIALAASIVHVALATVLFTAVASMAFSVLPRVPPRIMPAPDAAGR